MQYLTYNQYVPEDHLSDVQKLRSELWNEGYEASLDDIYNAWSDYSESMAAGWMMLEDPEYNVQNLLNRMR